MALAKKEHSEACSAGIFHPIIRSAVGLPASSLIMPSRKYKKDAIPHVLGMASTDSALSDATGVDILCAKGPEKRDGNDKGEERPKYPLAQIAVFIRR